MNKNIEQVVTDRFPRLSTTLKYLRGRNTVPSLIFHDHRGLVTWAGEQVDKQWDERMFGFVYSQRGPRRCQASIRAMSSRPSTWSPATS